MTVFSRLRHWRKRSQLDRDLQAEMDEHRQMLEDRFIREGMDAGEARAAAARRFGNTTLTAEASREEWGFRWVDTLFRDVRFAARLMAKRPAIVAAAVFSVALGVGANTAVVSVLQALLLNPMGVSDADRLAVATVRLDKLNLPKAETSGVEWRELRDMRDVFTHVAAMEGRYWTSDLGGESVRVIGRVVTPSFFDVFAVQPALGRFFDDNDREAVVLSWPTWTSQFGGDRTVLGRMMMLDGVPHRIIGVAPEHFRYPVRARVWTPLQMAASRLQKRGYNMTLTVVARLKPGVSFHQASARVNGYVEALKNDSYAQGKNYGYFVDLHGFTDFVAGDLKRTLWTLWAAALAVLFTSCASVAILLLSRTAGRRREIAIRLALGATRTQVFRQLVIESLLLGLLGGGVGIAMAAGATSILGELAVPQKELLALARMNGSLALYGLVVSLLCGFVFGLAPAVQLMRDNQAAGMARAPRRRFQSVFVAAEVAAAVVLLVTTTLLMRSFWAARQIDPGFRYEGVTTAFVLKPKNDPGFLARAETELRAAAQGPVALAYPVPFASEGLTAGFTIAGRKVQSGEPERHGEAHMVTPGYFRTLQIPVLRGRTFVDGDSADSERVCVIDSRLADEFFRGDDPLGQKIGMYGGPATIVGVVPALRATTPESRSRPVVYYALAQMNSTSTVGVLARSPGNTAPAIRAAIRRANGSVAVFDVQTLRERLDELLGTRRVVALLVLSFGGVCLLLAIAGLHGVTAQMVSERAPEIAVRLALGAEPRQILRLFLASGLTWAGVGLLAGLAAFAFAQRWIANLLFQVKASDGLAVTVACAIVMVGVAGAVWMPARRASRTDPQQVLRHE
ncbi:MAG TPA: ADOP family duplicated permease [Bryobacteraceae bacterium]|nr:ADOP family duplicated permease [Bryobacteraceae bacterium]